MVVNKRGEAFWTIPWQPSFLTREEIDAHYQIEVEVSIRQFFIGERIIATEASDYHGLIGVIKEARDGDDKGTGNETLDIYCDFYCPAELKDVMELENRFSELHGRPVRIGELPLDGVIMAPGMIEHYGKEGVSLG